jgi:hypothetical protein
MDRVHGAVDRRRDWVQGGPQVACGASGAMGLRSLLAEAGEEEDDEAVLVRGSPELERWWRGGAKTAKSFTSCRR